ncbi:MAG: c-type cytochrome domain-containing protein, partial [Pirellula sp.]
MLRCTRSSWILATTFWMLSLSLTVRVQADDPIVFNRDIRPILAEKCFACHGFDQKKREAGLRLDVREAAVADREGSKAIAPGNPDGSLMMERMLTQDADLKMP